MCVPTTITYRESVEDEGEVEDSDGENHGKKKTLKDYIVGSTT